MGKENLLRSGQKTKLPLGIAQPLPITGTIIK